MKKKLLIIMLALIMTIASAFALTACGETNGNGGSNTGNTGNGDNNGNTTVVTPGGGNTDNTTVVTPGGDTTVTTPETPDSGDNDNQGGSGNPGGENKNTDKDTDDNDNPEKPATEGLKYTLLADDTYEVTGYDGTATEINIPSTYNGKPVTSIGDVAFYTCTSLTSIEIPSSVTNIGVGAFVSCSSLTSITIPNSVKSIGDSAFYDCYRLVEVYNLSSLKITKGSSDNGYVGMYALDVYTDKNAPSKLTKENDFVIHTEGNVKTLVGYFGDRTSIEIPNSVTSIRDWAFSNCSSLTSITIPNSVTGIGDWAFVGCSSLTSITIPNSVTSIGDWAFSNCYRLVEVYNLSSLNITKGSSDNGYVGTHALDIYTDKNAPSKLTKENDFVIHTEGNVKTLVGYFGDRTSITIPNSVTSIGYGAFSNCSSLTSVTIPNSVTSIRDYAFESCCRLVEVYNLSSLSITKGSEDNGYVGYYALDIYTDKNAPSKLTKENDFVIHTEGNVKTLVGYFGDRTSITIPNSVTSIGDRAFRGCSSLTNITIPSSVTSIGEFAFSGCSSLTSITIPDSVTSIGWGAFYDCSSLKTINCEAESQPSGWENGWKSGCNATVKWGYTGK